MKQSLLQSLKFATAISGLLALYLVTSETLHLTLRSAYFLGDLGLEHVLRVIGWYVVFALAAGGAVGALFREPRMQAFLLSALCYALVSLKILWLDAELLANSQIAVAFISFTAVLFAATVFVARRFVLPVTFPVLLAVAYTNICLAIASEWALGGGRLIAFLFAPARLVIAIAGVVGVVGATALQLWLERRGTLWLRGALLGGLFIAMAVTTAFKMRALPTRDGRGTTTTITTSREPDLYILSFDALRSDMLQSFIARHPDSHLAGISRRATTFENVVAHGLTTDTILRSNTFAGPLQRNCSSSVPNQLARRGYFTTMIFGRIGRRFEGSVCYEYYFAGERDSLVKRYSLPALTELLSNDNVGLRDKDLRAEQLLEKLDQVAKNPRPLFAYLHFLELHAPYVPDSKQNDADYIAAIRKFMQRCYAVACNPQNPGDAKLIDIALRAYVELLSEVDRSVGRTLEIAKRRGRDFVVVITADHGELFGEHGGFAHAGGFVSELLDIPFVVFDSRRDLPERRCELMFGSDALRATAATTAYPNSDTLEIDAPSLGHARIDKKAATVEYEVSEHVRVHYGTWRNIHREPKGTLPYPIARCE